MHQSSFSGQSQLKVNTCKACTLIKTGALTWLSGLCVPMTLLRAIRTGKGQRVGSTQTSVSRSSKHGGLGLRPTTSFRKRNIFCGNENYCLFFTILTALLSNCYTNRRPAQITVEMRRYNLYDFFVLGVLKVKVKLHCGGPLGTGAKKAPEVRLII